MHRKILASIVILACCGSAYAQPYQFAPAYVDPDPVEAAREWVRDMWPLLSQWEQAQCPPRADMRAEQECVLEAFEREADAHAEPSPQFHLDPVPGPLMPPVLPDYDIVNACLAKPGMTPALLSGCTSKERSARHYLRRAFARLPRDQQLLCVGSVGKADQASLQTSATYYQALTVYCGKLLAKVSN